MTSHSNHANKRTELGILRGEIIMISDAVVRLLIPPVSGWLFLSGCDELLVDVWFACKATFGRDSWDVSIERLDRLPQQRLALFIPCWMESEVIEEMVDHNLEIIDYENYEVFLGVYPNDTHTMERATALERRHPRVHVSVCPAPGPTNKADCLNWIFQRMQLQEEALGGRFDLVVQHDAEDVIHPKAFKLINDLTGRDPARRYDMVQIPVLPLEKPARFVTYATYCDEFAEFQLKDIYTRQSMGGFVPSAGVGTAFRRDALEEIAGYYRNQIYNVTTLTEDYEIGLKFHRHGKRQFLVRKAVPLKSRNGYQKSNGNGNHGTNGTNGTNGNGHSGLAAWVRQLFAPGNRYQVEYIATREYFPHTFRTAVRQKSRWVMGVALQTWDQLGWRVSLKQIYWLWRDRKGLLGNPITLLSNLIFLYCLLMWAGAQTGQTGWDISLVFPPAGWVWWLVPFNTFFIFERWLYRIYAVNRMYGPRKAAGVIWRTPVANVINFASTITALATFFIAKLRREEVAWAKTTHAFPSREQLMEDQTNETSGGQRPPNQKRSAAV
jgi:bacteriophage N4 adsorption protein B